MLPHSEVDLENPIFKQGRCHIRWFKTTHALHRYNKRILITIPGLVFGWWLLERFNLQFGSVPSGLSNVLISLLLLMSLIVMLIASFSTMIITIGHLNQQLTSRQLDLLRLTHRGEWDVVMAHDALSQLRAWRIVPVEVALRIASVSIIFLNSNYDYYQSSFDKSLFIGNTIFNPLWWLVYIFILCISIAYMVEPVLRMRVIVAFSTVVALKLKHLPMALIAGTGAIMMVYLIQAVLIALTIWMGYLILINGETIFTFICVFSPLLFLMIGVLFVVYVRLRKSALTFSLNHVFDDRR